MKPSSLPLTALVVLLAGAAPAKSDAVLDWNAIAAQTIFAGGRPGPSAVLDLAVVQATVHDAVQAYDRRFEPYATDIEDASGSPAAAVARATRDVLVNRFPAQAGSVEAAYVAYLAAQGLDATDPGVMVGQEVAAGMIALRTGDGSFPQPPPPDFVGANLPGVWRPTPSFLPGPPPSLAPMAAPWLAEVTCFALHDPAQFQPSPPPALNSGRYRRDYNEVKSLGRDVGSTRTPEQTQLAYFWAENFFAQWNRALRAIAETYLDNMGDRARLFALAWLAAADGVIVTWDAKIRYVYWRPVTAIQEGNNDGNPGTLGDPDWRPFINTPNYPEYSSGANALTGGITRILALFFGTDQVTFTVTSNNPLANPNARTYQRFSDAAADVVEARIYQGIHFRTADVVARRLGRQIARWVFEHSLRPLHPECHADDDRDDHEDEGAGND